MSQETTYAGKLGDWRRLLTAATANRSELPQLEGILGQFETLLTRGHDLSRQQAAFAAGKQETSKQLKALLSEGDRMATALRKLLQAHYGIRSEKLAEFGLRPFRGRKPKEEPETPEPPTSPEPAAPPSSNP